MFQKVGISVPEIMHVRVHMRAYVLMARREMWACVCVHVSLCADGFQNTKTYGVHYHISSTGHAMIHKSFVFVCVCVCVCIYIYIYIYSKVCLTVASTHVRRWFKQ
jgi:hypothetical protein